MLLILGRRLLGALPVLTALVLVVFVLQKVAPVDPVVALVGEKAPPEVYEAARHQLGLDKPVPVQFFHYLASAVQEIDRHGIATFDVRPDVQADYNAELQRRMKPTIWTTGGCSS